MMSQPTFIRMPARAAWGIASMYFPAPSTSTSRIAAQSTPESRDRPPARMFTTVPMVAPAPGSPPIRPATAFPMPWPTSSLLGL